MAGPGDSDSDAESFTVLPKGGHSDEGDEEEHCTSWPLEGDDSLRT